MSIEKDMAVGLSGAGKFSLSVVSYRARKLKAETERYTTALMLDSAMKAARNEINQLRRNYDSGKITNLNELETKVNQLLNMSNLCSQELAAIDQGDTHQ